MRNHRIIQAVIVLHVVLALLFITTITYAVGKEDEPVPPPTDMGGEEADEEAQVRWRGINHDGRIYWFDEPFWCELEELEFRTDDERIYIAGIPQNYQFLYAAIDTESTVILRFFGFGTNSFFVIEYLDADTILSVKMIGIGAMCEDDYDA